jgi:integrase
MPSITLTDRFVAGVQPSGEGDKDYPDRVVRGLRLRVFASGIKSWAFRYAAANRHPRLSLGTYPAVSLAQARTKALEARAALDAGRDPSNAAGADPSMTVADLVASYLAKHVRPNLRTAAEVERRFKRNILPILGHVRLGDLHKRDINRVVDPILGRGRPVEATHSFEDLRALVRWCVRRGDLDHNITDGMRKPHVPTPRERALSDEEIRILWNRVPEVFKRTINVQRILKLCLITGQRVGEVAGLPRAEIDLKARVWSLPGSRTKNKRPHTVPLSDPALSVITEALADADSSPFLFPEGEGALFPVVVARTLGRALVTDPEHPHGRLGIAHFTAHDLRRTALTGMAKLGIAPIIIAHVANHRTVAKAGPTLGIYVQHDYEDEKRAALERWGEKLAVIVRMPARVVPLKARKRGGA